MTTKTTVLKVFVASPSDIIEERNVLEEIVSDLNKQLGSILGLRLEIIEWKTDTYPSMGEDAQSIINEQIGDSYDIFVGILWTRFGTPTKRGYSGTEEEFYNAYKRAREIPNSVKVMFYFNDKPVSISGLDQEQIAKIKAFQVSLGELGVYYWTYKELNDFARFIRMHLGSIMKEFGSKWGIEKKAERESVELQIGEIEGFVEENETEEEGFLDLVISSIDEINSSGAALKRITEIMQENTERTKKRTEELNQLPDPKNPNQARLVVNQFADDQEYFVERMKVEIPILSKSFRSGIDKWTKSAQLLKDFKDMNKSQIEEALEVITKFKAAIIKAIQSTKGFRDVVQAMPRLTTKLNHSKRKVVEILNTLIEEYGTEESLSVEAEKVFTDVLK